MAPARPPGIAVSLVRFAACVRCTPRGLSSGRRAQAELAGLGHRRATAGALALRHTPRVMMHGAARSTIDTTALHAETARHSAIHHWKQRVQKMETAASVRAYRPPQKMEQDARWTRGGRAALARGDSAALSRRGPGHGLAWPGRGWSGPVRPGLAWPPIESLPMRRGGERASRRRAPRIGPASSK